MKGVLSKQIILVKMFRRSFHLYMYKELLLLRKCSYGKRAVRKNIWTNI